MTLNAKIGVFMKFLAATHISTKNVS